VGDEEEAEALVARVTRRFVDYLRVLQPRDGEDVEPIDVQVEVEVGDDDDDVDDEAEEAAAEAVVVVDGPGGGPAELAAALRIPDDPSQLSFLLAGIVQVDPETRQELLEATSAEARLRQLDRLLDRELELLRKRLAPFQPDRGELRARQN
jgi:hypothetical protein